LLAGSGEVEREEEPEGDLPASRHRSTSKVSNKKKGLSSASGRVVLIQALMSIVTRPAAEEERGLG